MASSLKIVLEMHITEKPCVLCSSFEINILAQASGNEKDLFWIRLYGQTLSSNY